MSQFTRCVPFRVRPARVREARFTGDSGAISDQDIRDAYVFLMRTFVPGDQVFLFGFSRGSYTVRAIAARLHLYGLIRPNNDSFVPYAIRMLLLAIHRRRAAANEGARVLPACGWIPSNDDVDDPVAFVGVWDTSALSDVIENPLQLRTSPTIQTSLLDGMRSPSTNDGHSFEQSCADRILTPQYSISWPTGRLPGPLIEIEQPAEPCTASHATGKLDHRRDRDEAIVKALVIPFAVEMLDVLCHRPPEMPLADRNQPVEAFFFDRPHEAFRMTFAFGARSGVGSGFPRGEIERTTNGLATQRALDPDRAACGAGVGALGVPSLPEVGAVARVSAVEGQHTPKHKTELVQNRDTGK
jgi:hypothetical protein